MYGFIFNGFKSKEFYYEVIIQYRKILLIMATVTLSVVSPEIQTLVSLLVLVVNIIYCAYRHPFLTASLNKLDLYSQVVSLITLYSGMYFITAVHYGYD
mmetsp:Transcript_30512/g.22629  ORF Transcript_30512/g.22629 Transcript_30512/m.22629 type:complete len:99 (-) Transcript_30512:431-727(-)